LGQICNLQTLQTLKIRNNQIEVKGTQFLATSYAMRNLTILDMSQNQIMDDGFKFLTTASYLSNLHKLFVNDCGLTEKAA
jgi:Ran GTPase-activating protein (RanGAP) involved in mRNA processing and transport